MKKVLALLLVLALLFTMAGCEEEDSGGSRRRKENSKQTEVEEDGAEKPESFPAFDKTAKIEESILFSSEYLKIIATELSYPETKAQLGLLFQNTASTTEYSIRVDPIINGARVGNSGGDITASAGKETQGSVRLSCNELQLMGIDAIAHIKLGFTIRSGSSDVKTIYAEINTSLADTYTYDENAYQQRVVSEAAKRAFGYASVQLSEDVCYSAADVNIRSQCLIKDMRGDLILALEVENQSEKTVRLMVSELAINGVVVQENYGEKELLLPAGVRAIFRIPIADIIKKSQQEAYGIDEVGEIAYRVALREPGNSKDENVAWVTFGIAKTRPVDTTGTVLYESDDFRLVFKKLDKPYDDWISILLLAENKKGEAMTVFVDYDTYTVNGQKVSVFYNMPKLSNCRYGAVVLTVYDIEEYGLSGPEDVTEFSGVLEVSSGSYSTEKVHFSYSK